MNEQEQRIAIAEACGWEISYQDHAVPNYWEVYKPDKSVRLPYYKTKEAAFILGIPDYLNDLNACHEMEKVLDAVQHGWTQYRVHLIKIADANAYSATAAQRAEAFLKTIGKWEVDDV